MKLPILFPTLTIAAVCVAADPAVIFDAENAYTELHAKATQLAKRNLEDLGQGWKRQMTCMPGVGVIWQWDSCYMALFAGFTPEGVNGHGNLDNLYSMQGEDGYISMAYTYATREPTWPGRINPPLYAWCEWLYARRTGDKSRLARAYAVCSKYFNWLKANRTRPSNGLYYFEDTGSSGMDNSPRCGYFAEHQKGSDVCFIDLSCQQVLHAKCLAKIAPLVGKAEEAAAWEKEAEELSEKINMLMWSERTGFYHDIYIHTNNKLAVKTVAAYWALVSGVSDAKRTAELVEHLDEDFECENGVPSLSTDDPNYDPLGRYWLGGVWPPVQYMVANGLKLRGYDRKAFELAVKHLNSMSKVYRGFEPHSIWEAYAPNAPQPATDKVGEFSRQDFVGWGGLGPLVMLVENVIGIDMNGLEGRVDWRLHTGGRQGVKNFVFMGGKLTLVADVNPATNRFKIHVETDHAFRLKAVSPDGNWRIIRDVKPGKHDFDSIHGNNETDGM